MKDEAKVLCNELVALDRALTTLAGVLPDDPALDQAWEGVSESWTAVAEAQRDLRNALDPHPSVLADGPT